MAGESQWIHTSRCVRATRCVQRPRAQNHAIQQCWPVLADMIRLTVRWSELMNSSGVLACNISAASRRIVIDSQNRVRDPPEHRIVRKASKTGSRVRRKM